MIGLGKEEFEVATRKALEHLWDISSLRRSPLLDLEMVRWRAEQKAFPATPTDLIQALRDTLREAIDTLKPQEQERRGDRRWRTYHLLHFVYWEEQPGDVVAPKLYISRRTLYRDLNKAVSRLTDILRDMDARLKGQVPPLAKWVESIPTLRSFVGRAGELADYQRKWIAHHLIVVEGIAGIGKTSLGTELARRYVGERPVFWYTFRGRLNDDVHSVLLALAAFLARQGNGALWRFLQLSSEAATPQPLSLKISYLVNSLGAEQYVLCFDDFHLVNEDPRLSSLFDELQDKAKAGQLLLLIISRQTPHFVKELVCPPLEGLNRMDAHQLLERAKLSALPEELFDELYTKTGGNPQLLNLFAAWTMGQDSTNGGLQRFVATMPETREVHHYLLHNVYNSLEIREQEAVKVLSLLRSPTEYPAIKAVAGEQVAREMRTALQSLATKHIVEELAGEENVIFFHPVIREFCYTLIGEDIRQEWHCRAAEYFEGTGNDIEAAYHYLNAGLHERCADILISGTETLISRGQCRPLLDLVARLDQTHLTPERWLHVCLAEGEALIHTAAYEEATARFQAALHFPDLSDKQQAWIFHKLSWTHEILGNIDQALAHAQQGMDLFKDKGTYEPETGLLLDSLAWAYYRRGAHQRAYELICQAVEALETSEEYAKEKGQIYRARGVIVLALGDIPQAKTDTYRGMQISERIGHTSGIAMALNNLGSIALDEQELDQALAYFEQSLVLREQIGDTYGLCLSYHNIGEIHCLLGNLARGREHLEKALALAENMGIRYVISKTLEVLGRIEITEGNHRHALEYFGHALEIAEANDYRDCATDCYRGTAEVLLNTGDYSQALPKARRALEIAQEMDDLVRQAKSNKVLGQVLLALGQTNEAFTHLRDALEIAQSRQQTEMAAEIATILAPLERPEGQ